MHFLHRLALGAKALVRSRQVEADLDAELREFLQSSIDAKIADGMPPEAAARAARIELGSPAAVKEWVGDVCWVTRAGSVWQDARYAFRALRRTPAFAVGGLLTFGLGMGVNVAMFAFADRVLFRPLPFEDPSSLVTVQPIDRQTGQVYFMFPRRAAMEIRRATETVEDLGFAGNTRPYLLRPADLEPLRLTECSFNLLRLLRVTPIVGRSFTEDDARTRRRLVLLREETWRSRFGASTDIVNQHFGDASGPFAVVGILPASLPIPSVNWASGSEGLILSPDLLEPGSGSGGMPAPVARLRASTSVRELQAQVNTIIATTEGHVPEDRRTVAYVRSIQQGMFWNIGGKFRLLVAGGVLVWLVTCVNLGALVAARFRSRLFEMAIRASLGASAVRVAAGPIWEIAWLCSGGTLLAFMLLTISLESLTAFVPPFARTLTVGPYDTRVVLFAAGASLAGSLLAAAYPFWRLYRAGKAAADARPAVGYAAPSEPNGSSLLLVQSALAISLVLVGSLTVGRFVGLIRTDLGFRSDGLYLLSVALKLPQEPQARVEVYTKFVSLLASDPTIRSISAVDVSLFDGQVPTTTQGADGQMIVVRRVLPNYADALGTRVLLGNAGPSSGCESKCVALNVSGAAAFFPGVPLANILGRPVSLPGAGPFIVGMILEDSRSRHEALARPEIHLPYEGTPSGPLTILIRGNDGSSPQLERISTLVRGEYKGDVRIRIQPASERLEPWLEDPKFYAYAFGSFGVSAFFLAGVGLFALSSFDVMGRRREIAIQMALGAPPARVHCDVLLRALKPVVVGATIGLFVTFLAAKVMQTVVPGVDVRDPVFYLATALAFVATALAAAWIPAREATRTDALAVLRSA